MLNFSELTMPEAKKKKGLVMVGVAPLNIQINSQIG